MKSTATTVLPESVCLAITSRVQEGRLELPMLPQVAGEVMELCGSESADAAGLSQLLRRDQALASNVLRVANSPAYMPSVPIASLQQAVSRLGMAQVAEIAMAVSVRANLFQDEANRVLAQSLWRHSIAAGFFAKEIARTRRRNVETAFLCGLLHDVGKPVLLGNVRSLQTELDTELDEETIAALLDRFHNQAGNVLAKRWLLPPQIRSAILYHHDFESAEQEVESARVARLADLLAHMVLPGVVEVTREQLRADPVVPALNLYPDQLDQLLGKAESVTETLDALV